MVLDHIAAARLAVLQSLTAKLAAARSAAAVAAVIMTDGLERLGADVGVVALLSPDGRTLTNVGFEGVSSETRAEWESYPVDSPVPVGDAARTGQIVVVPTREDRNRRYPVLAAVHGPDQGGPVIALPLRIAQRTGGVLAFCFPDVAAFERHDIEFFQALADQCALALERAALEEDLRREQRALQEREARLNLIHENAGIGAWEWDAATNQVFWSDQYREVYGLDAAETPSFERGIAAVVDEDREPTLARLRGALDSGSQFRAEHRIRHPRKGLRWVAASGKVVRAPDGAVERMVGIVLDITDIKSAEMAVRDADRRKDEFLATLAHELRNPLAPIRNALQIMSLPGVQPATVQQAREVMERQVHHLARLVDDLLDVSRVMRGKIALRREPVAIGAVIARAVETVQPLIDREAHALETALGGEALHVDADPERLVQVIANLLTNSAKYTPRGGHIGIEAHADGDAVVLKVRDNGIGISPDVLPRVFDLFVQGGHGSVRAASGLGVGLTLVRNIVELHGGTVEARSDGPDAGTVVTVRLPRVAAPQPQPAAIDTQAPPVLPPIHALVVDDNRDAADSLGEWLRLQGHDVTIAYDGPAALEASRAKQPALVLLDIGMPGMDGYEVARRLRTLPGMDKAIIAALTGWGQQRDLQRSAQAGFDQHLVKPPDPGMIEQLIARLPRRAAAPADARDEPGRRSV